MTAILKRNHPAMLSCFQVMLQWLKPAELNHQDEDGNTLLHSAIDLCRPDEVSLLPLSDMILSYHIISYLIESYRILLNRILSNHIESDRACLSDAPSPRTTCSLVSL